MIRKATIRDIRSIHALLQIFGDRGELLPRPLSKLYDHTRDFIVYTEGENGPAVACCALQFCWDELAEIRSLAVHPDHQRKRIGARLVESALREAAAYDIRRVFTLTYRPDFFSTLGFRLIDRSSLPLKIWGDCIQCVKFPDCDENAMMREL